LGLYILVSTTGPFTDSQNCSQLGVDGGIPSTNAQFFVSLGQSLDGLKASVETFVLGDSETSSVGDLGDARGSGVFGGGIITVQRDPIIKGFNVLLFIGE
jgi:hypothetical protein